MSRLETIENLIGQLPCPLCLNTRSSIQLSCETRHEPCNIEVVCGHCNHKYIVCDEPTTMWTVWDRVSNKIKGQGCPECSDKNLNLEFLCDTKSEDCYFLVQCEKNNHHSRVDTNGIRYLFA